MPCPFGEGDQGRGIFPVLQVPRANCAVLVLPVAVEVDEVRVADANRRGAFDPGRGEGRRMSPNGPSGLVPTAIRRFFLTGCAVSSLTIRQYFPSARSIVASMTLKPPS